MDRFTFLTYGATAAFGGVVPARPAALRRTATVPSGEREPAPPIPEHVLRYPIVGEVRRFDGPVAPPGWAFCDGRMLAIAAYPGLFAILGRSSGGGEPATFRLPRAAAGRPQIIALGGWLPRSPAMLAAERPGEPGHPDVSVPLIRVLGRPAWAPIPVPERLPLAWPGTPPTAAFFARQRQRERLAARYENPSLHFSGAPRALPNVLR